MITNTNLQYQANNWLFLNHITLHLVPILHLLGWLGWEDLIGYRYGNCCNNEAAGVLNKITGAKNCFSHWDAVHTARQISGISAFCPLTCSLTLVSALDLGLWAIVRLLCLITARINNFLTILSSDMEWYDTETKMITEPVYFYNQVLRPHGIDPLPFSYSVPICMLTSATSSKKICRKKPRAVAVIWYGAPPIAKHTLLHTVRALFLSCCGESWKEDKKKKRLRRDGQWQWL